MGTCERNTDSIIDGLTGNLTEPERRALDEHLATCDDCRRESEAMRDLWDALAGVPVPVSPASTPHGPPGVTIPRRRSPVPLAVAASLILGLVGGYLAGTGVGAGAPDGGYLLLLRQAGPALDGGAPPESALVREYGAWAGGLAERGDLLMGERLRHDEVTLLASGGTDPTARETAPYISGFFLIRASSFDEATAVAGTMPHLRYGGSVEVRAVARD